MFGVPCPVLHSIASGVLVWSSFSVGVIAARTCSILFLNCTVLRVLTVRQHLATQKVTLCVTSLGVPMSPGMLESPPHFLDEEACAQKGEVTCLRSVSPEG